jgi:hypothetical protein
MRNPDHISECLKTIFGLKYLNSFRRIRDGKNLDPGWKFGSAIRNKHPGSATLLTQDPNLWMETGHFSTLFSLLDSPFPAVAETALAAISATTGNSDCVSDSASSGGRCHSDQCCGSGSGSTGSTCFCTSWIRIHKSEVWIPDPALDIDPSITKQK